MVYLNMLLKNQNNNGGLIIMKNIKNIFFICAILGLSLSCNLFCDEIDTSDNTSEEKKQQVPEKTIPEKTKEETTTDNSLENLIKEIQEVESEEE